MDNLYKKYVKKYFLLLFCIIFIFIFFENVYSQKIVTSYVIKIEGDLLFFDRGLKDDVRIGDEFKLLRDMPDGLKSKHIGIIEIIQVFPEISIGKISEIVIGEKPSILDKVEIAPVTEIPNELKDLYSNEELLAPHIFHNKITSSAKGEDINIVVRADAFEKLKELYLSYISKESNDWKRIDLVTYKGDVYFGKIESGKIAGDTVKYFLTAIDIDGRKSTYGDSINPIKVMLTSSSYQNNIISSISSNKGREIKNYFIPGYTQLKRNELSKGYMIISLEAVSILGGLIADKHSGIYFGSAVIVYLYNIFDGFFGSNR